jgi:hypothetical protein
MAASVLSLHAAYIAWVIFGAFSRGVGSSSPRYTLPR